MIREDVKRRSPGIVRPYHALVLLVVVLVAVFVIAALYVAQLQSRAAGEAKDLMYDVNAYLLDSLQGAKAFEFDSQDAEGYYITDPKRLEPYHGKPIKGEFTITINAKKEPLYVVSTQTQVLPGRFAVEVVAVYPKVDSLRSSVRWYRLPNEKEEKAGSSYVDETMESEAQE